MITLRCSGCKLIWFEDRAEDDEPLRDYGLMCPRCGRPAEKEDLHDGAAPTP